MRSQLFGIAFALSIAGFGCAAAAGADSGASAVDAVRGIVKPVDQAQISTDLQLPVVELTVKEGDSFRAGQVLVRFDCERMQAEWDASKATHEEMKIGYTSADYLSQKGAAGRLDVAIAKAKVDKAEAEQRALAARLKQCVVVAPFDGRVSELSVHTHEVPPSGRPMIGIVDERSFEIDLIAPSAYLQWIKAGQKLRFAVDETGSTYNATVVRIGAIVDPVSQTVKVTAGMAPGDRRVVSGMSGTAIFTDQELSQ